MIVLVIGFRDLFSCEELLCSTFSARTNLHAQNTTVIFQNDER